MTVQNPDPAILKARWVLDDDAGATLFAQSVEGTGVCGTKVPGIYVWPNPDDDDTPAQVDGPGEGTIGRRFHADVYSGDWPDLNQFYCQQWFAQFFTGCPSDWYPSEFTEPFGVACWGSGLDRTDCSLSFWFKRHTKRAGNLLGMGALYTYGYRLPEWNYQTPDWGLYFGDSENLCWTIAGVSIVSSRHGGIETDEDYDDGGWHHCVVTFQADEDLTADQASYVYVKLIIDRVLVGTWSTPEDWTEAFTGGGGMSPIYLGGGALYRGTRDTNPPDTSSATPNAGCGCDVYDIRLYCGFLTDDDIDEIYEDVVSPPTGSNILVFSGGLTVA